MRPTRAAAKTCRVPAKKQKTPSSKGFRQRLQSRSTRSSNENHRCRDIRTDSPNHNHSRHYCCHSTRHSKRNHHYHGNHTDLPNHNRSSEKALAPEMEGVLGQVRPLCSKDHGNGSRNCFCFVHTIPSHTLSHSRQNSMKQGHQAKEMVEAPVEAPEANLEQWCQYRRT